MTWIYFFSPDSERITLSWLNSLKRSAALPSIFCLCGQSGGSRCALTAKWHMKESWKASCHWSPDYSLKLFILENKPDSNVKHSLLNRLNIAFLCTAYFSNFPWFYSLQRRVMSKAASVLLHLPIIWAPASSLLSASAQSSTCPRNPIPHFLIG